MGMYTEIFINVNLKKETPKDVIKVLKAICHVLPSQECTETLADYPVRWECLFSDMSYYTPSTFCRYLNYDKIAERWSLLGKGDIKNYSGEIEEFFEWITPHIDAYPGDFIGYSRYEEELNPKLYFMPNTETEAALEREEAPSGVSSPPRDLGITSDDQLIKELVSDPPSFLKFELGLSLYDLIDEWWDERSSNLLTIEQNIHVLIDKIEGWLPKESSSDGSQNLYSEVAVEAENQVLRRIKSKLRSSEKVD